MFLVTGGWAGPWTGGIDLTETFDPLVGSWTVSEAKLPKPMWGLRAENINGHLLIFGRAVYR